jgi:membrane-associated phospholipid phosphatase
LYPVPYHKGKHPHVMKQTVGAAALSLLLLGNVPAAGAQATSDVGGQTISPGGLVLPQPGAPRGSDFDPPKPVNPFTSVGRDLQRFFSTDTAKVLGIAGVAAAMASTQDQPFIALSQERLQPAVRFEAGNIGGSFLTQAAAAVGTFAIGKATGHERVSRVGADLIRAQVVSQVVVQGVKFATHRTRPDGSNAQSFPSGHTASAFATATVLNRHFGWKAGIPAYAFAGYVGASRTSANKHHLSDVLMGAAVGIAAGRTVTVGAGRTKFDLGVAPTQGGAAVTFTRR